MMSDSKEVPNDVAGASCPSRCSAILTQEWLREAGFEQMFDGSIWWYHRNVPFVGVRYCDVLPRLCVGTSLAGWHIVTEEATRQKIRELCSAMGRPLDA